MNDQRTPSQLYGKLIITAKGILNITFWRLSEVQWPLPIQNRNQTAFLHPVKVVTSCGVPVDCPTQLICT